LADILPAGARFANLPIGTTEDRLLGGLDLDQALQGKAGLRRGLIHEAHGGVLYIDEVNLLADSLTDALLDVASSGRYFVERDGFSVSSESQFILLGSMNVEEGSLRPQLLDRFAISLDVEAPSFSDDRALIVESRLRFDQDPVAFCRQFDEDQQRLREAIADARSVIPKIAFSSEILKQISGAVVDAGVRSLRADLAVLRAATAHAALARRTEVVRADVDSVLPLVLHHRTRRTSGTPPTPPSAPPAPPPPASNEPRNESNAGQDARRDRIFPPEAREAPELRPALADAIARGRSASARGNSGVTRTSDAADGGALDVVASFTQSFRQTGTASLKSGQLIFRELEAKAGVRFIFVIDASGSHAAQQRMRAVKGVATALLKSSVDRKDEVAVICFRGAKAEIVLEPCRDADAAQRALEFLPTGGRTPLAHALHLAASLVNPASVVILLTDGRANVPLATSDPWVDALTAAQQLTCACVLVDSSIGASPAGAMESLASSMRARLIRLDDLNEEALLNLLPQ
jgi:magnesium chelatase subunit D